MQDTSYTITMNTLKKKRGRPAKQPANPAITFEKQLEEWEKEEKKVNFKELCEKLQEALAKSYVDAEQIERKVAELRNEIAAKDVIITYLESRRL